MSALQSPLEQFTAFLARCIACGVLVGVWSHIYLEARRRRRRMQPGAGACCQRSLETNGAEHDRGCGT